MEEKRDHQGAVHAMDRRFFLKTAAATAVGAGLLRHMPAGARGIPVSALPGHPAASCYAGPPAKEITTSITDLYKVGPGPSSSHTLAPLRIASNFVDMAESLPGPMLAAADHMEARLYGSLSSTGKGHRTDRAILAGLMGQKPETCDPAVMDALGDASRRHEVSIAGKVFSIGSDTVVWDRIEHDFPFSNTLVIQLVDKTGRVLTQREYYSTGGGFFSWKGKPEEKRGAPAHVYGSMTGFTALASKKGKALDAIMMENEMAIMGSDADAVNRHLDLVLDTMLEGVDLGLREEGLLPGPFEFHRKARRIYDQAKRMPAEGDAFMQLLSSYALAVAEGNAAGRLAVTAPTLGSAGTMPAVVYVMKHHLKLDRSDMRKGLLAAALVGFLCKNNASVAGAEVGCQGEIGVASSMAAAMLAYASGAPLAVTELAATIALEHHLGMSCDPVGGFVLIPCIERNAFGALKAYNAWLMAKNEIAAQHWEDLDRVIMAMLQTGKALPAPFKEMGTAGLGMTMVDC
jgi:L-serine dehydratase